MDNHPGSVHLCMTLVYPSTVPRVQRRRKNESIDSCNIFCSRNGHAAGRSIRSARETKRRNNIVALATIPTTTIMHLSALTLFIALPAAAYAAVFPRGSNSAQWISAPNAASGATPIFLVVVAWSACGMALVEYVLHLLSFTLGTEFICRNALKAPSSI